MKTLAIAAASLALVGCICLWIARAVDSQRPRGSDDEQLREMLYLGEVAAERHNAAGINRFISEEYHDSLGMSDGSLKYQIREYLMRRAMLDVVIPSEAIRVDLAPDHRTGSMTFPLSIGAPVTPGTGEGGPGPGGTTPAMTISLSVRKERVYYYYLFPGEEWRVISAEGYETGAFE